MPTTKPETAISTPKPHTVAIVLPVYNGARFLADQLDSLIGQTRQDWQLLVGDDGSTDASPLALRAFAQDHPDKVHLFDGPQRGISANVFSLLGMVPPDTNFVAFCDQDDIWHPDKLARACAALDGITAPALYCSRSDLIDETGQVIGPSPKRPRSPSFRNALVQNIASGNTMVLNAAGWALLMDQATASAEVPFHDWWAYQLISGSGGVVIHDPRPSLSYRQHSGNVLGASTGARGVGRRLNRVAKNTLSQDVTRHLTCLDACRDVLTPENATLLDALRGGREKTPLARLRAVMKGGFYRQSRLSTLGLWAAAFAGRF